MTSHSPQLDAPTRARLRRAGKRRVAALAEFRNAIVEANRGGCSLRAIAAEAGISHVAVLKIVRSVAP